MDYLLLCLVLCSWSLSASLEPPSSALAANDSDPDKDIGNQEAVTFYRSNGSGVDLGGISEPILTNVTAQRVVGVAPEPVSGDIPWVKLGEDNPGLLGVGTTEAPQDSPKTPRDIAVADSSEETKDYSIDGTPEMPMSAIFKRSVEVPVKVTSSATVVPEEAGINSIALPPLLGLNKNFSQIPVPIPNTAVVQYSKVNTLVHSP